MDDVVNVRNVWGNRGRRARIHAENERRITGMFDPPRDDFFIDPESAGTVAIIDSPFILRPPVVHPVRLGSDRFASRCPSWQHAHRMSHLHASPDDSRLFGGRRMTTTQPRQDSSLFDTPLPDPGVIRPAPVGREHPETSVDAAREVAPRAATQREMILRAAYLMGDTGITAAEAADVIHRSRNQTASRMLELRNSGWLSYTDDRRKRTTEGENQGLVHVITDAGRTQYEATRDA